MGKAFVESFNQIWTSIGAGAKFTIAATAIAGILTAVNAWKEHQEQLIQTAQRNAEAYSDSTEAIANYRKESESLITSINSGTLSSDEMYEARSRLLEIENELVDSYGAERDSLNLLTADIESATDAYDKLSQTKANEFLTNNQSQINKAIEEIYSDKNHRAATIEWSSTPDYIQSRIKDIVESNGGSLEFIQAIGSSLERAEITFNGTASQYFTPKTDYPGEYGFYCLVVNTYEEYTAQKASPVVTLTIVSVDEAYPGVRITHMPATIGWITGKCFQLALLLDSEPDDVSIINGLIEIFGGNVSITNNILEVE